MVSIGPSGEEDRSQWHLPSALLQYHSALLRRLHTGGGFRFPDVQRKTVNLFAQWMVLGQFVNYKFMELDNALEHKKASKDLVYQEYVEVHDLANAGVIDRNVEESLTNGAYLGFEEDLETIDFIKAWIFGEEIEAPSFQDYAMRILYSTLAPENLKSHQINPNDVFVAYKNTAKGGELRGFFCDLIIRYWDEICYDVGWAKLFTFHEGLREQVFGSLSLDHKQRRFLLPPEHRSNALGPIESHLRSAEVHEGT